jgi:hypothetical protein
MYIPKKKRCLNGNTTQFQQVSHPGQRKLDLTKYKEVPRFIKLRMSGGGSNLVTINIEVRYMMLNVLNVVLPHKMMVT